MDSFNFLSPQKIVVSDGGIHSIGTISKSFGHKALVCIGGNSAKTNGSFEHLTQSLRESGIEFAIYDGIKSDPDIETVEKGYAGCKNNSCDMVIGMGGGSVLDTAKVIALLAANGGSLADYEVKRPSKPMLPMIAIPTKAGTGSEVTKVSIITDNEKKKKMVISCEGIIPNVALLDVTLTYSMPQKITAATGMDALTHAIEAYISDNASPITDMFAIKAIKMIAGNIHAATYNSKNKAAKKEMLVGQMYAGLAFSNASTCLVHSMSRPMGVFYGIPHGEANAVLLVKVMEYNFPSCTERFANIAKAMGLSLVGGNWDYAKAFISHLKEIAGSLPLRRNLKEMCIEEKSLRLMAESAYSAGSTWVNPRKPTVDEIVGIYNELM